MTTATLTPELDLGSDATPMPPARPQRPSGWRRVGKVLLALLGMCIVAGLIGAVAIALFGAPSIDGEAGRMLINGEEMHFGSSLAGNLLVGLVLWGSLSFAFLAVLVACSFAGLVTVAALAFSALVVALVGVLLLSPLLVLVAGVWLLARLVK